MCCEYTFKKKKFCKESVIEKLQIFFENGDFLQIRKNEILDIRIDFYDMLKREDNSFYPVGRDGYIKLRLQEGKAKGEARSIYNPKEYVKDRKSYIENRLIDDGQIKCVRVFNCNNWSDMIFGDIVAEKDEKYLFLRFKENTKYGSYESEYHKVNISAVSKNEIRKILIDFENCDGFDVYQHEIVDLQLNFENRLDWNSSGYERCVKNGYMVLRLEDDYDRYVNVYDCRKSKKASKLEKRICGKGASEIDICNLYIHYQGSGYGLPSEEKISMPSFYKGKWTSVREERVLDGYYSFYDCYFDCDECEDCDSCDEYDEDDEYYYVSGYAQKQSDGTIMIVFGKELNNGK